MLARYRSP